MELRNCPECGGVFTYYSVNLCPACMNKDEEEFKKVRGFIIRNRHLGIPKIAEGTGVSEEKILRYIREGRINITSANAEMVLKCEVCGKGITSGRLCEICSTKLSAGLKKQIAEENKKILAEDSNPMKSTSPQPQTKGQSAPRMHVVDYLKKLR
ncbi:MAG: MerR family transcriptional regulator [Clostridia bacterium]|jgi:flagellar operon protein (TIGR03826 family)|nr:MerR family transcriptional regulator [Clostridia bacterium]